MYYLASCAYNLVSCVRISRPEVCITWSVVGITRSVVRITSQLCVVLPAYHIERNRTNFPSNIIERKSSMQFGHRTESNTELFFFYARTKSNGIERSRFDLVRFNSEIERKKIVKRYTH